MALAIVALAASMALAAPVAGDASPQLDVRIRLHARCAADDCPRTITADVFTRGDGRRLQRLQAAFPERARDVAASELLRVADFDFDGRDDIALCTGREALAGAPSYTFYRRDATTGRFVADPRLGALQSRASGFFVVDAARRRLRLEAHGGGGRTSSEYGWRSGRPVLMRRASADALDGDRMRLVLGERSHGRWRERDWIVPADAPWPAAFVAAEAALRQGG